MQNYNTLVDAISDLSTKGYVEDFNLQYDCLKCRNIEVKPDEFVVDQVHRFESSSSDPDEESVLYAISTNVQDLKGLLVSSFGIYADPLTEEMIAKLKLA